MNAYTRRRRSGAISPLRFRSIQLPIVLWLAVVWVAMWGDLSVANVLAGLVVGVAVSFVFPLPPVRVNLRVRPFHLVWLVIHFLGAVIVASVQVSVLTLRLRRVPRNAVIEVDLVSSSDLVLTIVAEMTSLVPGSIVIEARRSTHTLFLHVLDAGDEDGVARMRRQTLALERRVVRALGAEADELDLGLDADPQDATT